MNFWRLECFVTLAEELHFGRAAKRLHISQPALSQQVKQLEAEMGIQLADRSKGVALTPAGEILLEEGRKILLTIRDVENSLKAADAILSGQLKVLYARSLPSDVETRIVQKFRESYPHVEISAQSMWTAWNTEALLDGTADIAFVRLPLLEEPGLSVRKLGTDALLLAMPEHHELASCSIIHRDDMPPTTMVPWSREQAPEIWETLFESWDPQTVTFTPSQPDLERRIAIASHLNAVTPVYEWMADKLPEGMITRPIEPPLVTEYGIAWRRDTRSELVGAFVETAGSWSPKDTW